MAKLVNAIAMTTMVLAAVAFQSVVSEGDFKTNLGASVITLLRKTLKTEDNWIYGGSWLYQCNAQGGFESIGSATLTDAQSACGADTIKTLMAKTGRTTKTEKDCKDLVKQTLSNPSLCGSKETNWRSNLKDLEEVRALFAPAALFKDMADAVLAKAHAKLGIATGQETCLDGKELCYQHTTSTGFIAVSCVANIRRDCAAGILKPPKDQSGMFTVDDLKAICQKPNMHETQKECTAYLARKLGDIEVSGRKLSKLSHMTALVKPPTHIESTPEATPTSHWVNDYEEYDRTHGPALQNSRLVKM